MGHNYISSSQRTTDFETNWNRLAIGGIGACSEGSIRQLISPHCPIIHIEMKPSFCFIVTPCKESATLIMAMFDGAELNGSRLRFSFAGNVMEHKRLANQFKAEHSQGLVHIMNLAHHHRFAMTPYPMAVLIGLIGKLTAIGSTWSATNVLINSDWLRAGISEWLNALIASFQHGHIPHGRGLLAQVALGLAKLDASTRKHYPEWHQTVLAQSLSVAFRVMETAIVKSITSLINTVPADPFAYEPQSIGAFAWSFAKSFGNGTYCSCGAVFDALNDYIVSELAGSPTGLDSRSTGQLAWAFSYASEVSKFQECKRAALRKILCESASRHIKRRPIEGGTAQFDEGALSSTVWAMANLIQNPRNPFDSRGQEIKKEPYFTAFFHDATQALVHVRFSTFSSARDIEKILFSYSKLDWPTPREHQRIWEDVLLRAWTEVVRRLSKGGSLEQVINLGISVNYSASKWPLPKLPSFLSLAKSICDIISFTVRQTRDLSVECSPPGIATLIQAFAGTGSSVPPDIMQYLLCGNAISRFNAVELAYTASAVAELNSDSSVLRDIFHQLSQFMQSDNRGDHRDGRHNGPGSQICVSCGKTIETWRQSCPLCGIVPQDVKLEPHLVVHFLHAAACDNSAIVPEDVIESLWQHAATTFSVEDFKKHRLEKREQFLKQMHRVWLHFVHEKATAPELSPKFVLELKQRLAQKRMRGSMQLLPNKRSLPFSSNLGGSMK